MANISIQPTGGGNFFDQFDGAAPTPAPQQSPFADAISSIESSGNYKAVGPATKTGDRALGKYQVMSANVRPWSKEVLGREITPQEFMASPEIQDAVFNAKFGGYVNKYGPEGAARAWFAGEGGMNNPNAKDILGTSVAGYADKFTKALGPQQAMAFAPEPQQRAPSPQSSENFFDQFDGAPQAQTAPTAIGPEQADMGRGNAIGEGLRSGVTANFGDELAGASAAGLAGLDLPPDARISMIGKALSVPVGVARMIYESISGQQGGATQAYEENRDQIRADQQTAQRQYPGSYMAGQAGGAIALPGGAALQAATLPARMARGAMVGGAYGGASGAGEGTTVEDRASRAATGLAIGGTVGAVAPPLVEGAIQGVRAVANPVVTAVRGAINPADEAARRVVTGLQRDARVDPGAANRMTPQEFAGNVGAGGPATIMDMGGETTRGLARSAANTSPEGRQLLNNAIDDRFEGQSGRISDWLRGAFNFPNAQTQSEALQKAASAVNRPAYAKAYKDGDGFKVPLWDADLKQLVQAPEIQAAIRVAIPQLRNWAVKDGMAPPKGAFEIIDGRTVLKKTENGNTIMPSLQLWDYIKRSLDAMNTPTSRQFSQALRGKLDDLVPSYKEARAGAAHFFGAEDALEAGQNFVMSNAKNADARRALAAMSPTERQLFQDGFVSRYIETINATGDRRNILNTIAATPAAREKLQIALGPQRATELEARLRIEGIMDLARSAVQGGSTTARQLFEIGFAGGAGSLGTYGAYNMDPTQLTYAAVMGALLAGRRGIDQRVAQQVARMLTSSEPQMVMRGINLVSRNGRFMDSLRSVDKRIALVGGGQAPTVPALQAPAVSRAEDQPEIPGPSRQ